MNPPVFPCQGLPVEPPAARLLGLYPQRQEGVWMQRVRLPGGRLTGSQWRALAGIAREFTTDEPLHLTTRQDVEIHGLTESQVPAVQAALAAAELTGKGSCGDTIRNVTVCPCSGVAPDAPDLLPLAGQLTELLQGQVGAFALPRKFKISLSACPAGCAMPWINDIGLVALPHDGGWKFRAVVAGSLGAKPATGIEYPRPLEAGEILPFALAALRVFAAHGDRQHRHQARLRHVRQRLGDKAFLALLAAEFGDVGRERAWPSVTLSSPNPNVVANAATTAPGLALPTHRTLRFEDGNLSLEAAEALAGLAEREDLRVRIGHHHQVLVFAADDATLDAALAAADLRQYNRPGPRIVVCPGTRWCARGLADTAALAAAVRKRLAGAAVGDVLIGISGCPNGCALSGVADVGAIAGIATTESGRQEVWTLFSGGAGGRGPALAQPLAARLSTADAADQIAATAPREPDRPTRG